MNSQEKPKYNGTAFWFDGREYVIPPLSLRQVRELSDRLKDLSAAVDPGRGLDLLESRYIPIIHAAMTRNYPDLSVDQVAGFIGLDTYAEAFRAAMGRPKVLEVGEPQPVAESPSTGQRLNGVESTGASPQAPAGVSAT